MFNRFFVYKHLASQNFIQRILLFTRHEHGMRGDESCKSIAVISLCLQGNLNMNYLHNPVWSRNRATRRLQAIKAADLVAAMPGLTPAQRTYQIKKLVERKMLQPIKEGARQYTIGFSNNYLMRGVVRALSNEGFIPATLNKAD